MRNNELHLGQRKLLTLLNRRIRILQKLLHSSPLVRQRMARPTITGNLKAPSGFEKREMILEKDHEQLPQTYMYFPFWVETRGTSRTGWIVVGSFVRGCEQIRILGGLNRLDHPKPVTPVFRTEDIMEFLRLVLCIAPFFLVFSPDARRCRVLLQDRDSSWQGDVHGPGSHLAEVAEWSLPL